MIQSKIFMLLTCLLVACQTSPPSLGPATIFSNVEDTTNFYGQTLSLDSEANLLSQTSFYFDFDKSDIFEKDLLALLSHARQVMHNPKVQLRLEGHTDGRGSREYNIALGEKRAQAIANLMLLKGVSASQLNVVSFGKEKLLFRDHNDADYAKNRRVELIYESR